MYGRSTERRLSCVRATDGLTRLAAEKVTLDALADFCASKVAGGGTRA
jgi:hypothetical protein